MPLSSSSEKDDADDAISGDQEQETAFVVGQNKLKIPKSLQCNAISSNGRDEEMRKPLCNGNGKSSGKCPEIRADEDSGTPSGSLTPAHDAQTPSINETPLSLRRVSSSKPLPDLSAVAIKATVAVAAATAAAAEKDLNPRFQDQGCQTEVREKRKKRKPRNSLRQKPLPKTLEKPAPGADQAEMDRYNAAKLSKKKHVSLEAKRERKAAKTLAIVTGAFIACWLPFFILAIVMAIFKDTEFNHTLVSFFLWLGYFNSTLNPIIYTIFSPEFRSAFQRMLCGKTSTNHRPRHLQ